MPAWTSSSLRLRLVIADSIFTSAVSSSSDARAPASSALAASPSTCSWLMTANSAGLVASRWAIAASRSLHWPLTSSQVRNPSSAGPGDCGFASGLNVTVAYEPGRAGPALVDHRAVDAHLDAEQVLLGAQRALRLDGERLDLADSLGLVLGRAGAVERCVGLDAELGHLLHHVLLVLLEVGLRDPLDGALERLLLVREGVEQLRGDIDRRHEQRLVLARDIGPAGMRRPQAGDGDRLAGRDRRRQRVDLLVVLERPNVERRARAVLASVRRVARRRAALALAGEHRAGDRLVARQPRDRRCPHVRRRPREPIERAARVAGHDGVRGHLRRRRGESGGAGGVLDRRCRDVRLACRLDVLHVRTGP